MKPIKFIVTFEELKLLAGLASDQLFRRQFIDPKMPGQKPHPEEVALGKALVGRMQTILNERPHETPPLLVQSFLPKQREVM